MVETTQVEPRVGMEVTWKSYEEKGPEDQFMQNHLIPLYGKERLKIASIVRLEPRPVVTLERNGQVVKSQWNEKAGTKPGNFEDGPATIGWGWLRPV